MNVCITHISRYTLGVQLRDNTGSIQNIRLLLSGYSILFDITLSDECDQGPYQFWWNGKDLYEEKPGVMSDSHHWICTEATKVLPFRAGRHLTYFTSLQGVSSSQQNFRPAEGAYHQARVRSSFEIPRRAKSAPFIFHPRQASTSQRCLLEAQRVPKDALQKTRGYQRVPSTSPEGSQYTLASFIGQSLTPYLPVALKNTTVRLNSVNQQFRM